MPPVPQQKAAAQLLSTLPLIMASHTSHALERDVAGKGTSVFLLS